MNPSDLSADDLSLALALSSTPDLLAELVALSRSRLGFFPNTFARTFEYPWFATRMADCAGRAVLDVGAGVNVLPLWLADREANVVTIDNHAMERIPDSRQTWNEWGFFDYGILDPRIRSYRVDVASFKTMSPFDTIYSVSVLEHLLAVDRRRALSAIAGMTRYGSVFLLSVDLVQNTDRLWAMCEGRLVEEESRHGSLHDLIGELAQESLKMVSCEICRGIARTRTDFALIECRRT